MTKASVHKAGRRGLSGGSVHDALRATGCLKPNGLRAAACAALLALGIATTACDRAPAAQGLKEWSPADHDQEPGQSANGRGARTDAGAPSLVELTWQKQCVTCHGVAGRGDGPQAPMYKPSDLTREDWQGRVKDEEIAAVIRNGRGRMPKFDLPDDVVRGLVAKIRNLRGK